MYLSEEVFMKRKILGILLCTILISSGLITIFHRSEVKADSGGQGEENSMGFDREYLWEVIDHVANVVYTSYQGDELKKGRYFGSQGDRDTANYLFLQLRDDCSFGSDNVEEIPLGPIDEPKYKKNYYTDIFEVTADYLKINDPAFLSLPKIHDNVIQSNDFYPIASVYRISENEQNHIFSFDGSRVLNKDTFNSLFPKWRTGIEPLNVSYTALNGDYDILGNITYVPINDSLPVYQDAATVYLIDDVEGCGSKIDNMTNPSGVILIHDNSKGYSYPDASKWYFPVARVSSSESNLSLVKQLLENHTIVFADTDIYTDKLTFAYNFSAPACYPNFKFSVVYKWNEDEFIPFPLFCKAVYLRDRIHQRYPSVIPYDEVNEETHAMFMSALDWYRLKPYGVRFALPGVSVNSTVGDFLWDHGDNTHPENTIDGYIRENYWHESHDGENSHPAIETYDVAAYLNIPKSPDDKVVILSGRFDAFWNECPGDSGCGIGILMAISKYFQDNNIVPKYNLTFLFTTGEEVGYRGAQYYSDLHDDDNFIRWIGFDQLGFFGDVYLNVTCKDGDDRKVCEQIAKDVDYEGITGYNVNCVIPDYSWPFHDKLGCAAEDIVFYQRKTHKCDTILFAKEGEWNDHHRRGVGLTLGDVLAGINRRDINTTLEFGWLVTKYCTVNPNCWFDSLTYAACNMTGGTAPDTLKTTFTVKSVLPNDLVMIYARFYNTTGVEKAHQFINVTANRTGVTQNVAFSLPLGISEGDYNVTIAVYNSTARINRLAQVRDWATNDAGMSPKFHLNRCPSLGDIRIGTLTTNVHDYITGSKFTTTEYAIVHNITAYLQGASSKYQCMIYRYSDGHLIGNTTQETPTQTGWYTFSFTPEPILQKNTQYVLSIWGDNDQAIVYSTYQSPSNGYGNTHYTFGTPPQDITWNCYTLRQYSIFCRYTPDTSPPEITNVAHSPDPVGYGFNVTINADVTDEVSGVNLVNMQISTPGGGPSTANYTMTHVGGNTYRYIFTNTWALGQYNYKIWAVDNASNLNSSTGHHFHVSVQAEISIATLQNNYTGNQYINITDPPTPLANYTLVGRGFDWNTYYDAVTGETILETSPGPINYQNETGEWTPINCTLQQLSTTHPAYAYGYRIGNARGLYSIYLKPNSASDWPVAFAYNKSTDPVIDVIRSKLVGVGYVDPASNWAYHYLQTVQSSQGQTNGNSVTYPGVFTGTDVTWSYRNAELKEEITLSNATKTVLLNHPPSLYGLHDASSYLVFITKLDYQYLNLYNASEMLTGNVTVSNACIDFKDALGYLKCALPLGEAYELNNESVRQKLTYRIVHLNGDTYLLSGLKVSDVTAMTFPVVIDPTITVYSTANDGYLSNHSTNYNTAWTAPTGTVSSTGTTLSIGQIPPGFQPQYYIYRGCVFFNTSKLPSNAYIDNATLSLYKSGDYSATDFQITVQNGQPTYPHSPLQTGDYSKTHYAWNGGALNTSNFVNGYNTIYLNSNGKSWLNRTGLTKLCLRSSRDINGNTPTSSEYVTVYSNEQGMGYQPRLVITYRNQSKIKNTGSTSFKGYLLIQVQYNDSGTWVLDNDIVNETFPRTINISGQLALDRIFNGRVRASDLKHGAGTYRVYTAFRDPTGTILRTETLSGGGVGSAELKAWWQFSKT